MWIGCTSPKLGGGGQHLPNLSSVGRGTELPNNPARAESDHYMTCTSGSDYIACGTRVGVVTGPSATMTDGSNDPLASTGSCLGAREKKHTSKLARISPGDGNRDPQAGQCPLRAGEHAPKCCSGWPQSSSAAASPSSGSERPSRRYVRVRSPMAVPGLTL